MPIELNRPVVIGSPAASRSPSDARSGSATCRAELVRGWLESVWSQIGTLAAYNVSAAATPAQFRNAPASAQETYYALRLALPPAQFYRFPVQDGRGTGSGLVFARVRHGGPNAGFVDLADERGRRLAMGRIIDGAWSWSDYWRGPYEPRSNRPARPC